MSHRLGRYLQERRLARGLSLRQLADRCGDGLSFSYLSDVERGYRAPPRRLDTLVRVLGADIHEVARLYAIDTGMVDVAELDESERAAVAEYAMRLILAKTEGAKR